MAYSGRHADAGGEVDGGLAAGLDAKARHLAQNAARAAVDVEGVVLDAEEVHDAVGVVDGRAGRRRA